MINSIERLKKEIGIVVFTFCDNTKQIICTTLDDSKLPSGVSLVKGYFYDLAKGRYYPYREDAINVEVFFDMDEINLSEVDKFVNKFI